MPPAGVDPAGGKRIIVILEGRDAAGKGGAIKRIRERAYHAGKNCRRKKFSISAEPEARLATLAPGRTRLNPGRSGPLLAG